MKKLLFTIISSLCFLGCAKWVSVDISKESVTIYSPANNHNDSLQLKSFNWEDLQGSNFYQLQIVSPRFDSIIVNVLDSEINANTFTKTLNPGKYQWRVRGLNDDFESMWITHNLEITSTSFLNGQKITGVLPSSGTSTNFMEVDFAWDKLFSTESYLIQIYDSTQTLVNYSNSPDESYTYLFNKEGVYTVSIQAINDISASLKTNFYIEVDTTSPGYVSLDYPNWDTIKVFPTIFKWIRPTNKGSIINERIIVGTDSLLNNIVLDTIITNSSAIQLDTIKGLNTMFWKVNRVDAAGNINEGGLSKRFWIK